MKNGLNYTFFERLLPNNQPRYTVKEVAAILECSDQCVRDCFASKKLFGFGKSMRSDCAKTPRNKFFIPRESLVLFLMETANFHAKDFIERCHKNNLEGFFPKIPQIKK